MFAVIILLSVMCQLYCFLMSEMDHLLKRDSFCLCQYWILRCHVQVFWTAVLKRSYLLLSGILTRLSQSTSNKPTRTARVREGISKAPGLIRCWLWLAAIFVAEVRVEGH